MQWVVIALFAAACLLFAVGKWTRMVGRSADERAGADITYLIGTVLIAIDLVLLAGWAVWHLFFT